jgi:hypothetical protein
MQHLAGKIDGVPLAGWFGPGEGEQMIDTATGERLRVSTDGTGGPYIMLPLTQLDEVRELLREQGISFWVDSHAISLDNEPLIAVINLGLDGDAARVQAILDKAG